MSSKAIASRLSWHSFERLIKGYNRLLQETDGNSGAATPSDLRDSLGVFRRWVVEYKREIRSHKWTRSSDADRFNLLDVLKVTENEQCHSYALAWLLDYRIDEYGTHAQGNCGFRLLLDELKLNKDYARADYEVHREVPGDKSRIDIEVSARNKFIIHIENKITAPETDIGNEKQTTRQWPDLLERSKQLNVPSSRIHAFFLTPNNFPPPADDNFTPISWRQVAKVFDQFAQVSKDAEVKLFAMHYVRGLEQYVITADERKEMGNGTDMVKPA